MRNSWWGQSYEIKSPPWTILWFRTLGIFSVENIKRLCVFMFQTWDNSQLLRRVLWISAELTIVSSLKHKNTQLIGIFNRENPQNSEPQNGQRTGLDYIALCELDSYLLWKYVICGIYLNFFLSAKGCQSEFYSVCQNIGWCASRTAFFASYTIWVHGAAKLQNN